MVFNTGAALLDAIVLAVVSKDEEGTYGYKITQDVRKAISIPSYLIIPSISAPTFSVVYFQTTVLLQSSQHRIQR